VFIISLIMLLSYLGKTSDLVKSWYPDGSYRYPMKEFAKVAGIVIVSNILVALMTKTKLTAVIGLALAVAYLAFIWAMIFTAKFDKQIRAAAGLVIPMAINIVYCRARFAEGEYQHQWRTVKAFFWYLVLPLLLTLIIAVFRYCQLRKWIPLFGKERAEEERLRREYSNPPEGDRPDDDNSESGPPEGGGSDDDDSDSGDDTSEGDDSESETPPPPRRRVSESTEYEDIYSYSRDPRYVDKKKIWLIVTYVVCGLISIGLIAGIVHLLWPILQPMLS
jgi:uncharacterized membrane protein